MTRSRPAGLLSLGSLLLGLAACGEVRRVEVAPPTGRVQEITVRVDSGVIEVVTSTRVRVVQEIHAPEGAVERREKIVAGHLTIESRCKSPVFCSVDTRIWVPDGVPVHLELGQGEVWATGVGDLEIDLGTGMLDLDTAGALRARVGQGKIRAETTPNQLIRLAVGQGDIDLIVPRTPWQVEVQSSDTQLLGVIRDRRARGSLELTAPAGRVRVRAMGAPTDSGSLPAP